VSTDRFKSGSPDPARGTSGTSITRRGVLRLSAAAAAGALLPARATPAAAGQDGGYGAAFLAAVAEDPLIRAYTEPGREFWYRPGQLLAARADVRRVAAWLREAGVRFGTGKPFGGVGRFLLADDADVPALVSRLREPGQWEGGVPRCSRTTCSSASTTSWAIPAPARSACPRRPRRAPARAWARA
jgi:hypothetical protein